ncbi:glycoside hydrolase family 30 beta sandwich domain-containing protein [Massilia sp. ST3]|uniref:glycoside hydrolase family 30 protein n=1 Tax=Massilia sp. ST3 TaxID=2824903 RepID=UPI001B811B7D|nr:glycoside hydrolase family 30 beta sandwich domain-containing protein [Massilia sp. ST3]MBQ5946732.1 glycosyl hydrolase [Massilia sp. ST3]
MQTTRAVLRRAVLATLLGGWLSHAAAEGAVQAWVTTGDQSKLLARDADARLGKVSAAGTVIEIDPSRRYQEIQGFGASITDASAWLIQQRMNPAQREALLRELFGRDPGLGLSLTRLTIGASDFSQSHYSFDDMPPGEQDPELKRFSIDPQRATVLPTVQRALAINPQLKVMASPWSAPGWMKTSDSLVKGALKPQAYGAFARYLGRYLKAMQAEGVPIFALTLQNEPHFEPDNYPGMRVDPPSRAAFIGGHLGPLLAREHPGTTVFDWDHNWDEPDSPSAVLGDAAAAKYVSGVAWHCYAGNVAVQAQVHAKFPDKDTWFTECSGGRWSPDWAKNLMFFTRTLVIDTTRGWARGVLLWNLALDEKDGPHLGGCNDCRGVVTIDSRTGEVTRNVEYYALAHASRFVKPGAHRVASSEAAGELANVAFRNRDGSMALIVTNGGKEARDFSVRVGKQGFRYMLPANSVATFSWNGKR